MLGFVVTEESGKVFTFNADVFVFDKHNGLDYTQSEVFYLNSIPVVDDSGHRIGMVNLQFEFEVLVGKFFLDYSTPERFDIETATPLYPHLHFGTKVFESTTEGNVVKYVEITGVNLSL